MSDYTPTIEYTPTTEEVRRGWCDFAEWGTMTYEEAEDAFDHWLAQVKAKALRDAAQELDESTQADVNNFIGRPSPTYSHSDRYADVRWLELRADQIEKDT